MKLCIISDGGFFDVYGGGQVYVRSIVDAFIDFGQNRDFLISVISCEEKGNPCTPRIYRGVNIFSCSSMVDTKKVLSMIKPDVVHANGNYQVVSHTCKDLGIKCVITIHDSRWTCPNVTYLNTHEKLCERKTSVKQCLHCELSRIRFGKYAYPLVRYIPVKKYISIGQYLGHKPFMWYITPVLQAAWKVQQKIDVWNDIIDTADAVIEISTRMARMGVLNGLPEKKLRLVLNGIPAPIQKTAQPVRNDILKFFFTGRICYSKGVHVLLKAFHQIKNFNIELHLIGGMNEYAEKLKSKYLSDKRIKWHGEVSHSNVMNLISGYHVMVHPSIGAEACPLSILESLAAGKFVIATKCGGPQDLIIEGKNGWLIDPNKKNDLKEAIMRYINHPIFPAEIIFNDIDSHIKALTSIYFSFSK